MIMLYLSRSPYLSSEAAFDVADRSELKGLVGCCCCWGWWCWFVLVCGRAVLSITKERIPYSIKSSGLGGWFVVDIVQSRGDRSRDANGERKPSNWSRKKDQSLQRIVVGLVFATGAYCPRRSSGEEHQQQRKQQWKSKQKMIINGWNWSNPIAQITHSLNPLSYSSISSAGITNTLCSFTAYIFSLGSHLPTYFLTASNTTSLENKPIILFFFIIR